MRLRELFTNYDPGIGRRARAETMPGPQDNGLIFDGMSAPAAPVITKTPIVGIKEGGMVTVTFGPYSFEMQEMPSIQFIA